MKKPKIKKLYSTRKISYNLLLTPFKRALKIIGEDDESTSSLQGSMKERSSSFLTYEEFQKINTQLLKLEMLKAEGIQLVRERARCL
jgi:hypothetical protein